MINDTFKHDVNQLLRKYASKHTENNGDDYAKTLCLTNSIIFRYVYIFLRTTSLFANTFILIFF